jgi:DNA-binding beta-propeller fold protein YncE
VVVRAIVATFVGAVGLSTLGATAANGLVASSQPRAVATGPVGRPIGCSDAVAHAPVLSAARTSFATGLEEPFGVAFSPDGKLLFVDSTPASGGPSLQDTEITTYAVTTSGLVDERSGTLPGPTLIGMATNKKTDELAAAGGSGVSIFSMARLQQRNATPASSLVGSFSTGGQGAIETTFSPDGDYVFVTLEDSQEIAVFDLQKARAQGFGPSDLVGYVPLGLSPVGMAVSPNGRYLYATSEEFPSEQARSVAGPGLSATTGVEGTLSTIDLDRAEQDPSNSVISTVWAGCSPVRVVATAASVYVTARGSDDLLAFSASDLVSNPASAWERSLRVGELPVGLSLVDDDKALVVADSNRFHVQGSSANLAVVSAPSPRSLRVDGFVGAGGFPRDMTESPNTRLLVLSNFDSGQVESLDLASLGPKA